MYAGAMDRRLDLWYQNPQAMKFTMSMIATALVGTASAQTVEDSLNFGSEAPLEVIDTTATVPDTARYATFGSMDTDESMPATPTAAARAHEERASARSSSAGPASNYDNSSARRAGKGMKRTSEGPQLNVQRALDPEGRKHWGRMNKRSTRQAKGSPPGTVPVH